MAKIYESAGRRVQLTGSRQGRGFSAGTAVDRTSAVRQQSSEGIRQLERAQSFQQRSFGVASEAIQRNYQRSAGLQQEYFESAGRSQLTNNRAANELQTSQSLAAWEFTSQQADRSARFGIQQQKERENQYLSQLSGVLETNAQNRAQTTAALSQFSRTLSDFVVERVKAKNETDYKVGLAMAMNGELEISDGQIRQFKQAESVLANAAAAEGQLNETLSNVDLGLAEEQRNTNQVLRGWKAYGAAVGTLKRAASQYQIAMDAFMSSSEETVPLPDGRLIAPRAARGPSEVNAALAVGQQMFIEAAGLQGLNPLLIVEHLTPTVENVNNSIVANTMAQGRKEDKDNSLFELDARIGTSWQTLDAEDPDGVQDFFQNTIRAYQAEGVSRGEANRRFLDRITSLASVTENVDLLLAFELTPINPDNPGMGTLGTMFPEEFQKALTGIAAASQRYEQEKETEQDELVDRILADYSSLQAEAGTDKQALTQAFDQSRQTLSQLASQGNLKALNALNQLEMQGAYYNPFAYAQIVQSIERGQAPPSEEQLRQMELEGTLSAGQASNIRAMKPDDQALQLAKGKDTVVRNAATALIRENFLAPGTAIDAQEIEILMAPLVDTLSAEVSTQLRNQLSSFLARGETPSSADVNGLVQSLVSGYRTDPRFTGTFDPASGRVVTNQPLSKAPFVTQAVPQGATAPVRDFTRVEPFEIQNRQPNLRSSFVLTPQELTQNTQRFLNGQGPTPRAQQLMSGTGSSFENLLRNQSIAYNVPFTDISQSQLAQASAERRSLSPAAAAIIDNPNVPAWRKTRAFREINAARQRQEQARLRADQSRATPSFASSDPDLGSKVQALRPLMDLIGNAEGGAQQYNAINRGTAGDTPDGYPGLSNMTIQQVMNLQGQGFNAVGRYQFIRGTLAETVRDAGLNPNTTKFTPEVQDQLFVTRLTQSPVRRRLGAFLRGESNDITGAITDLSNEFAVIRNYSGRSGIEGIAGNRSSIEATHAAQLLRRAREGFRLARGSSRGAVYVVDSLGYGSTGPHIDVKPVRPGTDQTYRNLPSYRQGDLDRFVDLVLPDGRRGPLSRMSTTTDDDAKHRARGSFGHDYAAPKGAQVFLKGGARVVGSFKGDQNTDHLIIELPDGRRFQFLHGTQPR
jgi:hypothetical protein